MESDKTNSTSQVEECQKMMDSLCMKEQGPDVCKIMEKLKVKEDDEENDDMSYWE